MLYQTAGSRLFIADAPATTPGALPVSGWIEVGETEALGVLGGAWDMVDASNIASRDADGVPVAVLAKFILQRGPMQIVMGNDPANPGQAIIWKAWRSTKHFPFRLVFPDGTTTRHWFALVTGLFEVFDAANGVMKLQVDTLPSSQTYRSEDA